MRSFRSRSAVFAAAAIATVAIIPGGGSAAAGSLATHTATAKSSTRARRPGQPVRVELALGGQASAPTVLGPTGLRRRPGRAAAGLGQAAPPGDGSDTILHPWWEVYQPVDYNLTSRMGNEAAVQGHGHHLPQGRREGLRRRRHQPHDRAGRHVLRRRHATPTTTTPALYTPANFHKYAGDCPSASGGIEDFNNQQQVFKCELRRAGRPAHRHERRPQHSWPATSTS